jgi:Na+-translocating ferredoxin:NAD+ oxidoreductase subunit E
VFSMLLGMCPTMAMTTSATNGLGMGIATAVVMAASSLLVATFRNQITQEVRIPVYILIVAAMVTLVDLCMNAWMHELYKVLGLFIPLIVSNCLPLARLEAFAAKEPVLPSFLDGLFMGIGFTIALTAIGAVREIFGSGTLFADASLLLGPAFKFMEMRLMSADMGVLVMILPPGGFLVTGLLVVVKRILDVRAGKAIQMGGAHSAA